MALIISTGIWYTQRRLGVPVAPVIVDDAQSITYEDKVKDPGTTVNVLQANHEGRKDSS